MDTERVGRLRLARAVRGAVKDVLRIPQVAVFVARKYFLACRFGY